MKRNGQPQTQPAAECAQATANAKAPRPPGNATAPDKRKGADIQTSAPKPVEGLARRYLAPEAAAMRVIGAADAKSAFSDMLDPIDMMKELRALQAAIQVGDMAGAEAMLMAQAVSLQTLYARLIERGLAQDGLAQFDTMMRLALKAQAQCRLALEALATLKHGPAIMARSAQVNVAHGPQQVVNTTSVPPSPRAHGRDSQNAQNQLLKKDEEGMDHRTPLEAGSGHSTLATVEEQHGAKDD